MSDETTTEETMRRPGRPAKDAGSELAELRAAVAALTNEVQSLRQLQQPSTFMLTMPEQESSPIRRAQLKLEAKKAKLKAQEDAVRVELATGPKKFHVYHNRYPNRKEVVGAVHESEAESKFRNFNGIIGFLDSACRIVVEPYTEPVAA
jgi:hypothetical protein